MKTIAIAIAVTFAAMAVTTMAAKTKSFSVLSRPIKLKYGEVHNTIQEPISLPWEIIAEFATKPIAIKNYLVDIVYMEYGPGGPKEVKVPLYDGYNHHYGIGIGPAEMMKAYYELHKNDPYGGYELNTSHVPTMKRFMNDMKGLGGRRGKRAANFGGGSGAEERGTSHLLPSPYAHIVDRPEMLIPLIHLINTKNDKYDGDYNPLLECPCTPQRTFDYNDTLIDGKSPIPPFSCNLKFEQEENPSCFMDLYESGFRCCEHGVFLVDTDKVDTDKLKETTFYFKFNFEYEDVVPGVTLPVRPPACCDVTANLTVGGNIEYDVPLCTEGTAPEDCVHEMASSMFFDLMPNYHSNKTESTADPKAPVDLVYAVGHLHVGGLSLDLYDDATGDLICHSEPTYGTTAAAGDEEGYLVGMSSCSFGPPLRMTKDTVVRTVARYNNTREHHGVMALWLMEVSDPEPAALAF